MSVRGIALAALVGAGAVVGTGLVRRALAGSDGSLGHRARAFAEDVRAGMAERETDLRVALGSDEGAINADEAMRLAHHPASPPSGPTGVSPRDLAADRPDVDPDAD